MLGAGDSERVNGSAGSVAPHYASTASPGKVVFAPEQAELAPAVSGGVT